MRLSKFVQQRVAVVSNKGSANKFLFRCAILTLCLGAIGLQIFLFGFGSTRRGGQLGRFLDNAVRRSMFERAVLQHRVKFQSVVGYAMPEHPDKSANKVGVHVLLNSWLFEFMSRATRRDLAIANHKSRDGCAFHIIQANAGNWFRPIEWELDVESSKANETTIFMGALVFDENEMAEFMRTHFRDVYVSFYQEAPMEQRVQIFGVAALYEYGGIFVHSEIRNEATLKQAAPGLAAWMTHLQDCSPSVWIQVRQNSQSIDVIAATPKHPRLKCAINEFLAKGTKWGSLFPLLREYTNWDPTCEPRCCPLQNLSSEDTIDHFFEIEVDTTNEEGARFDVAIDETSMTSASSATKKTRCSDKLRKHWCSAGWLCNRCLRAPFLGTLESCWSVCWPCYKKHVCVEQPYVDITIEVAVKETKNSSHNRIPKRIHQTWFEDLTTARYPHFQRLQNAWKASGWDYRFYGDDDCVKYITQHYPARFAKAYDAILPGAFKADFFRLLVLFKDGGVYADIDVQLDTDLNSFITKDLAFFVPRDVPLDYWPDSNFCLWNGLMGAAPGNPIVAQAIADVTTTILNRMDYYDVEGKLCSQDSATEVWKLRTLPILILTGPCALGISVNTALGKENLLQGHDLGWLHTASTTSMHEPKDHFWGDSLTLLADRYDMGELRFSDVDRNIVVGSSNQDRIAKAPISNIHSTKAEKLPVHYSKSETDVVGEYGTYKDDQSTGERIQIKLRHEYV